MSDSLTIAFEVEALDGLTDAASAFDDARGWSTHVGVVSEEVGYRALDRVRDMEIYGEDFFSQMDQPGNLDVLRTRFTTDRHVYVGTEGDAIGPVDDPAWEFLTIEEAAEAAGWALASVDLGDTSGQADE